MAKLTNHFHWTRLITLTNLFMWLWRWILLRLSKLQSPATVLFRITFTWTITQDELLILLGSNYWKSSSVLTEKCQKMAKSNSFSLLYAIVIWLARTRSLHVPNYTKWKVILFSCRMIVMTRTIQMIHSPCSQAVKEAEDSNRWVPFID